jgi:peroxiredoxin
MKNFAAIILFALSITTVLAQKKTAINTTINATITGLKSGEWVYCITGDGLKRDSVKSVQNGFHFKLNIPEGEGNLYILQLGKVYNYNKTLTLFLDKGTVIINGKESEFKEAKLSGTTAQKDWNDYANFTNNNPRLKGAKSLREKSNVLRAKKDSIGLAALQPQLNELYLINIDLSKQWVSEHPNSSISAYVLSYVLNNPYVQSIISMKEIEIAMNKLSPAAKNNLIGKRTLEKIRIDKKMGIGTTAPSFTQNDTQGKPVSLKDFRGKYVLIDFWASWCHPCRAENPAVVKVFNEYKDKNFTIIGVSLDSVKENWLEAIKKDGLTWTHVSDLKGWKNVVAEQYHVVGVPQNYLLDKEGKIIAKDLHGKALTKKLAELLD